MRRNDARKWLCGRTGKKYFSFYNKKIDPFCHMLLLVFKQIILLENSSPQKAKKYLKTGKLNSEASFLEDSGLYLSMDFGSSSLAFK